MPRTGLGVGDCCQERPTNSTLTNTIRNKRKLSADKISGTQKVFVMSEWEQDLQRMFSTDQLQVESTWTVKSSASVSHWGMSVKLLHRWHYMSVKLSWIFQSVSPFCWRPCGQLGTFFTCGGTALLSNFCGQKHFNSWEKSPRCT